VRSQRPAARHNGASQLGISRLACRTTRLAWRWDHLSAGMGRSLLACEQACAISRAARCVLPRSKEELLK